MVKMMFLCMCVTLLCYVTAYNLRHNGAVYEGDMILPIDTIKKIENNEDLLPTATKCVNRGGGQICKQTANLHYRWDGGRIPYSIHKALKCSNIFTCFWEKIIGKESREKLIKEAMNEWMSKTCVKFVKRQREKDFIEFIDDGAGKCYSNVGHTGGRQVVALGSGCRSKGIIMHELGHVLGFFHEQSRTDRDSYINILWDNIKEGAEGNFQKYKVGTISDMKVPYDYDSIMHYNEKAFADWPNLKTIIPKKYGVVIGQRKYLSALDVKEMNRYYNCPSY